MKIDNLCHIAHNVLIEDNCFVIALSMLGGSAHLCEAHTSPRVFLLESSYRRQAFARWIGSSCY